MDGEKYFDSIQISPFKIFIMYNPNSTIYNY